MLFRPLRSAVAARPALLARTTVRPFHQTIKAEALSESDVHREEQERKAQIDAHKHDSLEAQKLGKNKWKRELSSESEAAVKADRSETDHTEDDIAQLQKEGEKKAGST